MIPLGPRLAVKRGLGARTLPWGLVLPTPDSRDSHVGEVLAVGSPQRMRGKLLPLDVAAGQAIIYSSRVDAFQVGDDVIDIVEEASVIGVL